MATKPVVVGVDGSEESLQAVEWAALEAKRHSSPLRIVSAPALVPRVHAYNASPSTIANALRGISARALEAAITRCEEVAPGLPVTTSLLSGPPALAVAECMRMLLDEHGQRLAREALFMVVYALRPGSREWLLGRYAKLTKSGGPPL